MKKTGVYIICDFCKKEKTDEDEFYEFKLKYESDEYIHTCEECEGIRDDIFYKGNKVVILKKVDNNV
jgi:hypothetical protein